MMKKIKLNHNYNNHNISDEYFENNLFWKVVRNKYLFKLVLKHTRIFNNVYYLTKYLYFEQDSLLSYPYWSYLTIVALTGEFNYTLKNILPPYINRITFRSYSFVPFENDDGYEEEEDYDYYDNEIPSTINNLTIMDKLPNKNQNFKIPLSIVRLIFGGAFNSIIPVGFIGNNIKYLKFCYSFNQDIGKNVIPNSVTHIQFSNRFSKNLEFGCNLPTNLKSLKFGQSFTGVVSGKVPPSLESLYLPWHYFNKIDKVENFFNNMPNINSKIYIGNQLFKSKQVYTIFKSPSTPSPMVQLDGNFNKLIIATQIESLDRIIPPVLSTIKELVLMCDILEINDQSLKLPNSIKSITFFSKEYLEFKFYNGVLPSCILPDQLDYLDLGVQIPLPNILPNNLKQLLFNPTLSKDLPSDLLKLPSTLQILKNNNQNQFYPISNQLLTSKLTNLTQLGGFTIISDGGEKSVKDRIIDSYQIDNLLNDADFNNLPTNCNINKLVIQCGYSLELLSRLGYCNVKSLTVSLHSEEDIEMISNLFINLPSTVKHLKIYCEPNLDFQIYIQYIHLPKQLENIDIVFYNPWSKPMSIVEVDNDTINNIILRTNCK